VYHVLGLLFFHVIPADFGQVFERGAESFVILLPSHTFENGIGIGKRSELELRRLSCNSE